METRTLGKTERSAPGTGVWQRYDLPVRRHYRVVGMEETSSASRNWGIFDARGCLVLLLEESPPECRIRACDLYRPGRKGRLLATFLGPDSFRDASEWAGRLVH